jgi:hypothetical protein
VTSRETFTQRNEEVLVVPLHPSVQIHLPATAAWPMITQTDLKLGGPFHKFGNVLAPNHNSRIRCRICEIE